MGLRGAPPAEATGDTYVDLLRRLLPRGEIWRAGDGTDLGRALAGIAPELARSHNAALAMLDESDPRSATLALDRWEAVYRLPDPLYPLPDGVTERRAALAGRVAAVGGQTEAYYVGLAASAGIVVTIDRTLRPAVAGDPSGSACWGDWAAYVWAVRAPAGAVTEAAAGDPAGTRLVGWRQPVLESLLLRYAPAHTRPIFLYTV